MDISKDLLITNGFEYEHDKGFGDFDEADIFYKAIGVKKHETYTIIVHNRQTNYIMGRHWTCIINNDDGNPVATVEVETTDQLNKLFDIMNINYSI